MALRRPRRTKGSLPKMAGIARDEDQRLTEEDQRADEAAGRGQPLPDIYLTTAEAEALRMLSLVTALSPSVVVGLALLELAAARGIKPKGG